MWLALVVMIAGIAVAVVTVATGAQSGPRCSSHADARRAGYTSCGSDGYVR